MIEVADRNPVDITHEIVDEVLRNNEPPQLFRMGSVAVRLRDDGTLEPYDADRWLYHVAELVDFYKEEMRDKELVRLIKPPPAPAMKMVSPAIMQQLPLLDGIIHTPYLTTDGELVCQDGYHPDTRLVLHTAGLTLPAVPQAPTEDELAEATRLLTEDWLGDFPFAGESDRANVIALLLTLTGRAFFGIVPLTIFDASTPGAGKGLLASTTNIIASGSSPHLMELPVDGEEQRKKITTALMAGIDVITWDESHIIAGRTLAMILTAETYSDRILGGNKLLAVKNRFTQIALGNNVQVWGDLKRRVVPVRLEPDQEHPEMRTGFRHPNLEEWVGEQRGNCSARP
jgi:putative DNA primase/helicase